MKFRVTRIFLLKLWRATMRNHCPLLITDPPPSSMPSSSPGEQGSRSVPAPPWTAGRLGTEIGPQKNISNKILIEVFQIFYFTCTSKKKNCARMCLATRWVCLLGLSFLLWWKISLVLIFFWLRENEFWYCYEDGGGFSCCFSVDCFVHLFHSGQVQEKKRGNIKWMINQKGRQLTD